MNMRGMYILHISKTYTKQLLSTPHHPFADLRPKTPTTFKIFINCLQFCILLLLLFAALKFCFKTCVAMKFVDDDDDYYYYYYYYYF